MTTLRVTYAVLAFNKWIHVKGKCDGNAGVWKPTAEAAGKLIFRGVRPIRQQDSCCRLTVFENDLHENTLPALP